MRRLRWPVGICARGLFAMMYNRLTTIVIASVLSFATIGAAAAHHRHHQIRSESYVQYASLNDSSLCTERPWNCETSPVRQEIARAAHHRVRVGHAAVRHGHYGLSLSDLTSTLATKVREIVSSCGARLVSGYRP